LCKDIGSKEPKVGYSTTDQTEGVLVGDLRYAKRAATGIRYLAGLFHRRDVVEFGKGHGFGMGDRFGQPGDGDRVPTVFFPMHHQGGRGDLPVVREPDVEVPGFGVLVEGLGEERQVLPQFGTGDRVPQAPRDSQRGMCRV
jgi:hypothetical protein